MSNLTYQLTLMLNPLIAIHIVILHFFHLSYNFDNLVKIRTNLFREKVDDRSLSSGHAFKVQCMSFFDFDQIL